MSKPVKALLRKELVRRLSGVESLAVLSLVGVDGVTNNRLRQQLRAKEIRLTVVKNAIARQAFQEVGLQHACDLLDGPCALATGGASVVEIVREVMSFAREAPALMVRGALMEGRVFGPERVDELSRYPTREEAVADVAGLALAPGRRLAAALLAPGGRIAGAVKTLADRGESN
jgi:large subunit ribosomal protein L10